MPVKMNGATSGYTQLQAAATAANNTLTLPSGNGMLVGQSTTTAPTNGQIPIGNGTDYTPATITAGTGITVTNGAGSISIANTGGAVAATQLAKAWVNFDGTLTGTITPRASYNVSSVTKNATGDYKITFSTALADANYVVAGSANQGSNARLQAFYITPTTAMLAGSVSIGLGNPNNGALLDSSIVTAVFFGN